MLSLEIFYANYPISTKFSEIIGVFLVILFTNNEVSCIKTTFYRFTGAKRGVTKILNKIDLRAIFRHFF